MREALSPERAVFSRARQIVSLSSRREFHPIMPPKCMGCFSECLDGQTGVVFIE